MQLSYSLLLVLVGTLCGHIKRSAGSSTYLDAKNLYKLDWEFTDVDITFTVTVNTTGWVGLGFSPNGGMAGSDIVTGWVYPNGTTILQDRHASGERLPDMDIKQDYKLLMGKEAYGQTILQFTRLLNTHDTQDRVISEYTMRVIYAYGSSDPTGSDPTYHGPTSRGTVALYLLNPQPDNTIPNNSVAIEAAPEPLVIPSESTVYWCSLVKLPQFDTKMHIVKYEPTITPGNEDIVHHMLVYACYGNVDTSVSSYDCFNNPHPPNSLQLCQSLIAVWAVGGGPVYYTPEAGYPLGADNPVKYILFQTHYNNVLIQKGRVDNSGIRFIVTKTLRQFDAGVLQIGTVNGVLIPPQQTSFVTSGFCSDACINEQTLPKGGITIFGITLHSHLLGRRIILRRYRNGVELPPLGDDPYFDFNYQQMKLLLKPEILLPGDSLQAMCVLDSTDRKSVTYGGLTTMNEMCLTFVMYYPRVDLLQCSSLPQWVYNFPSDPMYKLLNVTHNIDWNNGISPEVDAVNWKNPIYSQAIEESFAGLAYGGCSSGTDNITWQGFSYMPPKGSSVIPTPISVAKPTGRHRHMEHRPLLP